MKQYLLLPLSLGILCGTFYFQYARQRTLYNTTAIYQSLQKELKTVEDELNFLKKNHTVLDFLIKKGWLHPQHRLIAGEKIIQHLESLGGIRFTFDPETIEERKGGYSFKVSKITFQATSLTDIELYDFITNILENFPGILILRKLSIHRQETPDQKMALSVQQHKHPHFVGGEIMFEWVSMADQKNEE